MGLEQPMNYLYICSLDMGYAQVKSNHKFSKMYIVIILHNMKGDVLHFYFYFYIYIFLFYTIWPNIISIECSSTTIDINIFII